jgi:hypothetical protein
MIWVKKNRFRLIDLHRIQFSNFVLKEALHIKMIIKASNNITWWSYSKEPKHVPKKKTHTHTISNLILVKRVIP